MRCFIVLVVLALGLRPACAQTERSIYRLDGRWTDDAGRSMALSELAGHPVVLALFFTHCAYACPIIVHDMKRTESALAPAARERTRFVLVSFDSERDTPEALKRYRGQQQLDPGRWILLHGDPAAVRELAAVLGIRYARDPAGQFAHSNLITVLNAAGEIAQQRTGLQGDPVALARAVEKAAKN